MIRKEDLETGLRGRRFSLEVITGNRNGGESEMRKDEKDKRGQQQARYSGVHSAIEDPLRSCVEPAS